MKTLVGGVAPDYLPLLMQIEKEDNKPPEPFKFNDTWLEEEWFRNLVIQSWKKYEPNAGERSMFQFAKNLKKVKRIMVAWAKEKAQKA